MKVIGLCGGSGSGKGAICDIFQEKGILVIDTDTVYRKLTGSYGPLVEALKREFGKEIITEEGALNRRVLADIVFSGNDSGERLERLNKITHKYILDETRAILNWYSADGATIGVVDAPVLFESGFDKECDFIVCVIADKERRISRIMSRDSITYYEAERRIASQMSDDELISRSDAVIYNNDDLQALRQRVESLIDELI